MPIEIEKKYRLTKKQREAMMRRLRKLGASPGELEFEENTIYRGGRLDLGGLRHRRAGGPGDARCIGDGGKVDLVEVEALPESERGVRGFGSTAA